jgi:hypothetical protein
MHQALAWTRLVTDWLARDIGNVQQAEARLKRRQLLRRFFQGDGRHEGTKKYITFRQNDNLSAFREFLLF